MPKSLTDIRDAIRRKADLENDLGFISQDELTEFVNQSVGRLWDILCESDGFELLGATATVTTDTTPIALPADLLKLVRVAVREGGVDHPMRRGDLDAYYRCQEQRGRPRFYLPEGGSLAHVWPRPTADVEYRFFYIPDPPTLAADADEVDFPSRWVAWVELDAAITCAAKEESDAGGLMLDRERVERAIRTMATTIDHGEPKRIRNVRRRGMSAHERMDKLTRGW